MPRSRLTPSTPSPSPDQPEPEPSDPAVSPLKPASSRSRKATQEKQAEQSPVSADDGVHDLSFRQARTALDLTLAQLQSSELEVETMATLVRQAQRYADRCEAVLRQVEQDVMQWDPQDPGSDPTPLM